MKTYADRHDEEDKKKRHKEIYSYDRLQRQIQSMTDEQRAEMHEYAMNGGYMRRKTEISQPGDPAEMQADAVAESFTSGEIGDGADILSHQPADVSPMGEGEIMQTSDEFDQQLQNTKGQGQPLDEETRSVLEEHMGADLSDVNVHTSAIAGDMSESINARAFAHGKDIYFNEGEYDTESEEGMELLAHEVAHTVQEGGGLERKVQRQDGEDTKLYYSIAIPPGTTSKEGFRHYAEMIIFGQIVNLDWAEPGPELAAIYDHIESHIGDIIQFGVWSSQLKANKVEPGENNTDAAKGYNSLKGQDKKEIVDEINKRYYDRTGIKQGTAIQPGDVNNIAVWNKIRDEVMKEKALIDNLPPDIKKFIHIEKGVKPEDFKDYAAVAELLSQFNTADFLDYQDKVNFATTDLETLRSSLEDYLREKGERKTEADNLETIKTKLYGLEGLYTNYKNYLQDLTTTDELDYRTKKEKELDDEAKQNGFANLEDFLKTVSDYQKAFEASAIRLAEDHLYRYRSNLYQEEKRLNDPVYISNLFRALQASGAKEHFKEAASKRSQASNYGGDDGKTMPQERVEKTRLQQEGSAEESEGEFAIKSLDSILTKEEQFDYESFAEISSEEEMKSFLLGYLWDKRNSIDETWDDVHAHPDHVYELDALLAASMQAQNIKEGSIYDMIIKDKAAEINKNKILKTICFVIIGLVLTVVTFGAAGPVAIAAGIASAGISLYGVYEAAEDYKRNNAANDVGLLTDDPSLFWVMLAIVGAVVDLAALSSAFKAAKPLAEMTKEFNTTMDVEKLEKDLATLTDLDTRLQQNILKQARIQAQEDKLLKGLAATRGMLNVTIPGLAQTGELVARAIFALRKGLVSIDSFILELRAAKIIGDVGLNPEEMLLVKNAFTKARTLSTDERLVADIEKAIADKDFTKLKLLTERGSEYYKFDYISARGTIIKNKLEPHEFDQAKEIVEFRGGNFEGPPTRNYPGIDGKLDGASVSLKEYTGTSPIGVLKHVSKSEAQIKAAGFKNVDVFVNAKNVNAESMLDFASKGPLKDIPSQGVIKNIYIQVSDGWIEIGINGVPTKL